MNFEKYALKCQNNFVQDCQRQLIQKLYLWTSYFIPPAIFNVRRLQLEHFTQIYLIYGEKLNKILIIPQKTGGFCT